MKDGKFIKRLKKGDAGALEAVIREYSGYVCTVARNFSRGAVSEEDIDEICSDVFYKLWRCRENLDAEVGLRPYLSAAARNSVKDRFKKLPPNCEDISEFSIPSDFSVENAAELREMMQCLNEGLAEFPERERDVFLRFYLYGESSSQIAKAKQMTDGAVRTMLCRIRAKIKVFMKGSGFDV